MRMLLQIISYLALALLVIAPVAFLAGSLERELMQRAMLTATVAWFVTAPLWIGREQPSS